MKQKPRLYRMGARADAAAQTHRKILESATRLVGERPYDELSLADIARDAGVTVQTVLRRFGSKDGLTGEAAAFGLDEVRRSRWNVPAGDHPAALKNLTAHYEAWGERSLRFLAEEQRSPAIRRVTDAGRALHHEWVDHVFGDRLSKEKGAARARLRARVIACTDVFVWKILRRDLGFDAKTTERTLAELLNAVLA